MIDELDLILSELREEPAADEAFVRSVMADVRQDELKRLGRRRLRKPTVTMLAAAALVTGGAVAAVVGSNPETATERTAEPPATTIVATEERASAPAPRALAAETGTDARTPISPSTAPVTNGYPTEHTSVVTDAKTGLRLTTEAYTNTFTVGESYRTTLTLENTGKEPVSVVSPKGCGLQAMATPAKGNKGDLSWSCAGSEQDPRTPGLDEQRVLAPGERVTADAFVTLATAGEWSLVGVCRCAYETVEPAPVPKNDPVSLLTQRALPAPLLVDEPDGRNLATPPIRVFAR